MTKYDPLAEFRAMTKDEQRENILNTAAMCIDGAPKSLARKIEIYFDETEEDRRQRRNKIHEQMGWNE